MNDPKILVLISKHIEGKETQEEKTEFINWLNENENNQKVYSKIKNTWLGIEEPPTPFLKKFNRKYMTNVVIQKTLGNLVGFAVGVLITNSFTHYVTERRSVKNLFGLAGRKKIQVNDTPEWVYMFGHLDQAPWRWSAGDRRVEAAMMAYWVNFVRGGNPNGNGVPAWPAVKDANGPVLALGEPISPAAVSGVERLKVFDAVYSQVRRAPLP